MPIDEKQNRSYALFNSRKCVKLVYIRPFILKIHQTEENTMKLTQLYAGVALALGLAVAGSAVAQPTTQETTQNTQAQDNRLVLLGTQGGPRVGVKRANPANLIVINGKKFVVDAGYGVSMQMVKAGYRLQDLDYIFITHMHSDHTLEYGNLFYNAWVTGGLKKPVQVYGPTGMKNMTEAFFKTNEIDITTRMADEGRADPRKLIQVHEIQKLNPVFNQDGVKVSAIKSIHPPFDETYSFKFEFNGKTVVFSGDTAYNKDMVAFAKGADYLVHEVQYEDGIRRLAKKLAGDSQSAEQQYQHFKGSHTNTEELGRLAQAAGVKNLVLTHYVPGDDPLITDAMWEEGVKQFYQGNVVVGKDLTSIDL